MSRGAVLIAMLVTNFVVAQSPPEAPAQSAHTQSATNASPGRPPLRTKTREEYQAYQVAIANAPDPTAMEKAAEEFAAKFPHSEVRVLLYREAMSGYQNTGNPKKMTDMGLKVLAIDPEDPEALIGVAEVLEERTSLTDLDRVQREGQVIDYASHALKTIDTDLAVPAGTPPERLEAYKKYLRSTALAIVGTMYYKQENYAAAESKLRDAIDADPSSPDAVVVLRLALALDQEKKYSQALEQANRAVEETKEDSDLGRMARNERDRLVLQSGGNVSAAGTPENSNSAQSGVSADPKPAEPASPVSH
jgi:tetratricopeptide (TPR) repeat protein